MANDFAPGTPPEVRQLIADFTSILHSFDLPTEQRAALARLASNESMEPF
jgi:hypothetical protein